MKLLGFALMVLVELVLGQAPYPPRGYRPPGPQFELPVRKANPNPPQPQRTYGSPQFALPTLEPADFRTGQSAQENRNQQRGFPAREYGFPDDTVAIQSAGAIEPSRQYGAPSARVQKNRERPETFTTGDDEDVVGVGNQNYPKPTVASRAEKPVAPQEAEEGGDSSVAIANAVANRGQYYFLGPSEMFQRIMVEDRRGGGGQPSRLLLQNIAQLMSPLYGYNNPMLITLI
ncbi:uncharacterized protein LOC116180197 [Photinus pyralis]|uniref:uncharacterized protein LOC116180197 n=1 Tax=Photinus pyralis TaxID=7054 RepID=UPI0012673908|nr:uncharacterized protein LOC116180197 [Photinus pyralis]